MNEEMANGILQAYNGIMNTRPLADKMDKGVFEMFICMLIEEWQLERPEEDTLEILDECRAAAEQVRGALGPYK